MTDVIALARRAREQLSAALGALQAPGIPEALLEVAQPIAKAMGLMHQLERQPEAVGVAGPVAFMAVRNALDGLQVGGFSGDAVCRAMDGITAAYSSVYQLSHIRGVAPIPAAQPPVPAAQPAVPTAQPLIPAEAAPQVAARAASPVGAQTRIGYAASPPTPAGENYHWSQVPAPQNPAARQQPPQASPGAVQATAQQYAHQPSPPQPQYAPSAQAAAPRADYPYPGYTAQPMNTAAPINYAQPQQPINYAQPPVQLRAAEPPPPFATAAQAAYQTPYHAPQPPTVPTAPVHVAAQAALDHAAIPLAQRAQLPVNAGPALQVEASLGAHSATNFYKGLSGNDVIESGGLFIATYNIPAIGQPLHLKISMPGGFELEARAVVRWSREAPRTSSMAPHAPPGYGVQLLELSPEGRHLVYRYVRNREPMFHDEG